MHHQDLIEDRFQLTIKQVVILIKDHHMDLKGENLIQVEAVIKHSIHLRQFKTKMQSMMIIMVLEHKIITLKKKMTKTITIQLDVLDNIMIKSIIRNLNTN